MKFLHVIGAWINEHFSHEEAISLVLLIIGILLLLLTLGSYLAPVITGLVIAFLLQGLVTNMERIKVPRLVGVAISFLLFLGLVFALVLVVVPLLWAQLQELLGLLPTALSNSQGAEFRAPIAVLTIGGMITSTLLTLIVVPVLYDLVDRVLERTRETAGRLLRKLRPGSGRSSGTVTSGS